MDCVGVGLSVDGISVSRSLFLFFSTIFCRAMTTIRIFGGAIRFCHYTVTSTSGL